jgi:hypothetical protein
MLPSKPDEEPIEVANGRIQAGGPGPLVELQQATHEPAILIVLVWVGALDVEMSPHVSQRRQAHC